MILITSLKITTVFMFSFQSVQLFTLRETWHLIGNVSNSDWSSFFRHWSGQSITMNQGWQQVLSGRPLQSTTDCLQSLKATPMQQASWSDQSVRRRRPSFGIGFKSCCLSRCCPEDWSQGCFEWLPLSPVSLVSQSTGLACQLRHSDCETVLQGLSKIFKTLVRIRSQLEILELFRNSFCHVVGNHHRHACTWLLRIPAQLFHLQQQVIQWQYLFRKLQDSPEFVEYFVGFKLPSTEASDTIFPMQASMAWDQWFPNFCQKWMMDNSSWMSVHKVGIKSAEDLAVSPRFLLSPLPALLHVAWITECSADFNSPLSDIFKWISESDAVSSGPGVSSAAAAALEALGAADMLNESVSDYCCPTWGQQWSMNETDWTDSGKNNNTEFQSWVIENQETSFIELILKCMKRRSWSEWNHAESDASLLFYIYTNSLITMICHIIWSLRNKSCHCQPEPERALPGRGDTPMNDRSINESDRNKSCNENIHRLDISTKTKWITATDMSHDTSMGQVSDRDTVCQWQSLTVRQSLTVSCVGIGTNQNDNYNKPSWFTKLTVSYYWTMQLTELNGLLRSIACQPASSLFCSASRVLFTFWRPMWCGHGLHTKSVIQIPILNDNWQSSR